MFGDEIRIEKGGKKVGLKALDAYSDANTDDLADDSDLDTSTRMYNVQQPTIIRMIVSRFKSYILTKQIKKKYKNLLF